MKTPFTLLTAALLAPDIFTSPLPAQVWSVNAVGYVNLSLEPGLNLIANPLNSWSASSNSAPVLNHLNTLMPLPDSADGTVIFRFDPVTQRYRDAVTFFAGFGWYPASGDTNDPVMILPPGEGFFIQPAGPTPLDVTLVGEVLQGHLVNPIPPNDSLKASLVPQTGLLASQLAFPSTEGDRISHWDTASQRFNPPTVYLGGVWLPEEPLLNVAQGFRIRRDPLLAATDRWWVRDFSVNPAPAPLAGLVSDKTTSDLGIRWMGINASQVILEVVNATGGPYHVQFSADGFAWRTVAENQKASRWTATCPGVPRGCYRVIKP